MSVTVKGANGQAAISGDKLRSSLGLPDDRLWINADRRITGEIRQVRRPRLLAWLPTSRQVLVAGGERQKFDDGTIFHSGSAGAHLLRGPVLDHLFKGGPAGRLGFPTSDVHRLANGNLRASFERGVITCDPDDSSRSVT